MSSKLLETVLCRLEVIIYLLLTGSCGVARRFQQRFIGNFPVGVDWAWSSFLQSTELLLYFIFEDGLASPPGSEMKAGTGWTVAQKSPH
jgi:hypothetical protein